MYRRLLPATEARRRIVYAFTLGGIMMAAERFRTDRANQISIKVVELICQGLGSFEKVLELLQKAVGKGDDL